jgi:multidrug efflux pump subunit AcrA (membrane-fusion protein)
MRDKSSWLVTTAACGLALFAAGCGGGDGKEGQTQPGQQTKAPLVILAPVTAASISRAVDLTGEVVAVNSVTIAATVEGPVGFCPWREGDRVERAGQKLVEIDRELYRAEAKAAEAALGVAQARLADMKAGTRPEEIAKAREAVRQTEESATFAKSDLDRVSKMVESGSLPGESLEKARVEHVGQQARLAAARQQLEMLEAGYTKTTVAVQEAAVKESEAKVDLAQARLAECVIAAPFAGTITRVHVRPGDMAAMKVPLLEMADFSSLVVRVAVPEAQAGAVREGLAAAVRLDALPGRTFEAKVARAYPELDRRMRTRTVELTVADKAALAPGMFARVGLVLETAADAAVVPREAVLVTPAGGRVAFVVEDGKAVQRKVTVGIEAGGKVQVLSGLRAGEKVVIQGHEKLKDGAEVRMPEAGEASAGKSAAGHSGVVGQGSAK